MMQFIALLLVAFFSTVGFIAILYAMYISVVTQEEKPLYLLVPIGEKASDAELQIRSAQAALQRLRGTGDKSIVILDCGMQAQTREMVEKAAQDAKNIFILQANELQKLA